ncbi:MAG: ATP-binding protein, partial [Pseudomonadota bacterium]
VEFEITDSGIGIPEEEIKEIFDAFTVSSKTKTPAGGRGVGLVLCKATIEAHGGSISAESKGGRGAQFRFVL